MHAYAENRSINQVFDYRYMSLSDVQISKNDHPHLYF
jgi:hypothetical protein